MSDVPTPASATPPDPLPPGTLLGALAWVRRNHAFIAWLYSAIVSTIMLLAWILGKNSTPPENIPGPPPPIQSGAPPEFGQGWICDPEEVAVVVSRLETKHFAATPAGLTTDLPKSVFLWKAYEKLFGAPPPIKNQGQVGSCVSFGTDTAVERTQAVEIANRGGASDEWARFTEEVTYGGSRVEIGGGRIRGDGSVGAWAAQWFTKYGGVPRKQYPTADLTNYSESRCREYGSRGVPAEFETVAKQYPVHDTTQVKDWTSGKKALANGYAIAVCSNQGFTMQRDANGVCRPSGHWGHCMCCDGYYTDTNGKEYGHIVNSWGPTAHTGPVGWGNPNPDGFWADSSVIDQMFKAGDSWTFSGVKGFPRKKLNWLVQAEPKRLKVFDRENVFALAW